MLVKAPGMNRSMDFQKIKRKVILENNVITLWLCVHSDVEDSAFITRAAGASVTQQETWGVEGGGWAVLVATNFFNFTVNFLGNYWCF